MVEQQLHGYYYWFFIIISFQRSDLEADMKRTNNKNYMLSADNKNLCIHPWLLYDDSFAHSNYTPIRWLLHFYSDHRTRGPPRGGGGGADWEGDLTWYQVMCMHWYGCFSLDRFYLCGEVIVPQ